MSVCPSTSPFHPSLACSVSWKFCGSWWLLWLHCPLASSWVCPVANPSSICWENIYFPALFTKARYLSCVFPAPSPYFFRLSRGKTIWLSPVLVMISGGFPFLLPITLKIYLYYTFLKFPNLSMVPASCQALDQCPAMTSVANMRLGHSCNCRAINELLWPFGEKSNNICYH